MSTSRRAPGRSTTKRRGRGSRIDGPPEEPFVLKYPGGWRKIAKRDLQQMGVDPTPVAGIRRSDGLGQVTLSVRGPLEKPVEAMREDFVTALEEKFGDTFDLVTSSIIEIPAGRAMYTSWVLREDGRVQGHLTVQVGQHSYLLDAAIVAGAAEVARDVGAMFGTFAVGAPDQPA